MNYIVNYGKGPEIEWISKHALPEAYPKNAVGPYFTFEEAEQVLTCWSK